MRHPQTPAEAKLWARLRSGHIDGLRFKRQHPIGRYIVDFYCGSCRLVVEIDGDTHVDQADYDASRTGWLEEQGYRVLRFFNSDVHENIAGVLEAIFRECGGEI